jgi:hypothetical protein
MKLKEAIELVLNEAESSALGENNQEVLDAVEMVNKFYRVFGHHFQNFTLPEELNLDKD